MLTADARFKRFARRAGSVALVLVIAVGWIAGAVPAIWSARLGINNFQDDAFYYLIPAMHFAQTGVFTFDGATPTNGFHPLWMLIVVTLVKLLGPAPPETLILAVLTVERLLLGVAIAFCAMAFMRLNRQRAIWGTGFLAVIVLLMCPAYIVFEQGMETTLATLLFLVAIYALVSNRTALLACTLPALFLCRLDSALFVGLPMGIAFAWWNRPRGQRAVIPLVTLCVVMAANVGWNVLQTGHAVPISGAIRSSFPEVRWGFGHLAEPLNIARMYGWRMLTQLNIVVCGALLLLSTALCFAVPLDPDERRRSVLIGTVGLLLLANLLVFQRWEKSIDPRYLAMPTTAGLFVLGSVAQAFARYLGVVRAGAGDEKRRRAARALWLAPALLVGLGIAVESSQWLQRYHEDMSRHDDALRTFYEKVSRALPQDAVLAGTDVGALAFWTGRRVINLDGVMNSYAYQKVVADGQLGEYLDAQGVTHIATPLWDRDQTYTGRPTEPMYRHQIDPAAERGADYDCHKYYVYAYLYGRFSDTLCLRKDDEVFRAALGLNGVAQQSYVVYRLER